MSIRFINLYRKISDENSHRLILGVTHPITFHLRPPACGNLFLASPFIRLLGGSLSKILYEVRLGIYTCLI